MKPAVTRLNRVKRPPEATLLVLRCQMKTLLALCYQMKSVKRVDYTVLNSPRLPTAL